jgi:hypothetical protein
MADEPQAPVQILMMLSRKVRRVPMDFEHPRNSRGDHQPLYDGFYVSAVREWLAGWEAWQKGEHADQIKYAAEPERVAYTFEEWHGTGPDPDYYYPGETWPEGTTLGICMYEDVMEGTPISAIYPDTEEGRDAMARELAGAEHGITTGMTAEEWRQVIDGQVTARDIHTGEVS